MSKRKIRKAQRESRKREEEWKQSDVGTMSPTTAVPGSSGREEGMGGLLNPK